MKPENNTNTDFCVCCGNPVPEGRMVCSSCERNSIAKTPSTQLKPINIIKKLLGMAKERRNEP